MKDAFAECTVKPKLKKADVKISEKFYCARHCSFASIYCYDIGDMLQLLVATKGTVHAPRAWWESIRSDFAKLIEEMMDAEPRLKGLNESMQVGVILVHVDDFLLAGDDPQSRWQEAINNIRQLYTWGEWQEDHIVQRGVAIHRIEASFKLEQTKMSVRKEDGLWDVPIGQASRWTYDDTTSWSGATESGDAWRDPLPSPRCKRPTTLRAVWPISSPLLQTDRPGGTSCGCSTNLLNNCRRLWSPTHRFSARCVMTMVRP